MRRALWAMTLLAALIAGCSEPEHISPEAERGRKVYAANCVSCHNVDPSKPGPVGPAVKGASRELIEERVMRAAYPPGYKPKRDTKLMVPFAHLADKVDDLAAYLR